MTPPPATADGRAGDDPTRAPTPAPSRDVAPHEGTVDAPGFLVAGDALRAVAALAVVLYHAEQGVAYGLGEPYRSDPSAVSWVGPWLAQGSAGVWVFFALSGYLVGGPWVRSLLGLQPVPRAGRYVARRLRRIVPAFWVVLAVVLVRFGAYGHDAGDVLRLFAFAQNAGRPELDGVLPQGWTLGCELAFYALFPLLVAALAAARLSREIARALFLVVLAAMTAASLAVKAHAPGGDWSLTILGTAWGFAPGLVLAAVEDRVRAWLGGSGSGAGAPPAGAAPGSGGARTGAARGRRRRAAAVRALALLLLAGAAAVLAGLALSSPRVPAIRVELLHGAAGGALVAAALLWQWGAPTVPRALRSRAAHALGTWSYGIYLVHIAVGREVRRHWPHDLSVTAQLWVNLAGMVVGSVVAAAVLWWLVEQPALTGRRPRAAGLLAPLRRPVPTR